MTASTLEEGKRNEKRSAHRSKYRKRWESATRVPRTTEANSGAKAAAASVRGDAKGKQIPTLASMNANFAFKSSPEEEKSTSVKSPERFTREQLEAVCPNDETFEALANKFKWATFTGAGKNFVGRLGASPSKDDMRANSLELEVAFDTATAATMWGILAAENNHRGQMEITETLHSSNSHF
ncbi:MAG: hypothetical protein FE78DRAFT_66918 [Acidomyces sp. 'richmondensis']|nr:MAG: hypothetical protein FE78DRAFT_66918 [Acidomyces sp. 'richmondensis']